MKPLNNLALRWWIAPLLLTSLSAPPQAAAQHAAHTHAGSSTSPIALTATEERDALILRYGPIVLPAGADHHSLAQPATVAIALPADGWIAGFSVDVVDSAGRPLPRVLLHHANVISAMQRELFSDIMLRVAAAGPETSPVTMPSIIGYRVHRGDTLIVSAMMQNPTTESRVATLRIRFPFKKSTSRIGAVSIFPFYLDVMPPAQPHSFDLRPGKSVQYWEGKPQVGGRILGVGGHMHKYGTLLRLEDRTEGKVLWEAKPTTDSAGEVEAFPVTRFIKQLGLHIYPDHVYRLTAYYDNPTGAVIPDGGMGALGGVFVPERGVPWPRINRASADYRADVLGTYRLEGAPQSSHGSP
jgi:hypothetical protein